MLVFKKYWVSFKVLQIFSMIVRKTSLLLFFRLYIWVVLFLCFCVNVSNAESDSYEKAVLEYIEAHHQLRIKNHSNYEMGIIMAALNGHHMAMLEVINYGFYGNSKNISIDLVLKCIAKLKKLGYVQASFYEGMAYLHGIGFEKDEFKALEIFEGITEDYAEAKKYEFILKTKRSGLSKDNPLGDPNFKIIKNAAEKGSGEAMFIAGEILISHNSKSSEDYNLGLRWINRSAELGFLKAQLKMSDYHYENSNNDSMLSMHRYWRDKYLLNPANPDRQHINVSFLEKKKDKTTSEHTSIGLMYMYGIGDKASFEMAGHHLKIASEKMDPLGLYYYSDWKNKDEKNSHFKYFKKTAELGFVPAYHPLGFLYGEEIGLNRDLKASLYWVKKAASGGSVDAINTLGTKYAKGHYVKQDYQQAVQCYKKSAELGSSLGMCNLAEKLLGDYDGIELDYNEAHKLLDKASYLGDVEAYKHLSKIYGLGLGVQVDTKKAMYYFSYYAVRSPYQIKLIDQLCFLKDSFCYNPKIGLALLESESRLGNLNAINSLYRKYFDSKSDYYDISKGEFWLNLALKNNHAASFDYKGNYELLYVEQPDLKLVEKCFIKAIELGYGLSYYSLSMLNERKITSKEELSTFLDLSYSGLKYGDERCRMNMAYVLSFGFSDVRNEEIIRHTKGIKKLWAVLLQSMALANQGQHKFLRAVFDEYKYSRFAELFYQRAKYSQTQSDYTGFSYVSQIRTAAFLGHPLAQIEHYYSRQSKINKELITDRWYARNWIKERAIKGDLVAQLCMAFYYFTPNHFGNYRDWGKVKKWLAIPLSKNIVEARCLMNMGLILGYEGDKYIITGINGLKDVFKQDYIKSKMFFTSFQTEVNTVEENLIRDLANKADFATVLDKFLINVKSKL